MRCLNPIGIKNPKNNVKTENEKGEKIASVKFIKQNEQNLKVPCGECMFCLSKNSNDFTQRLVNELKVSESVVFIGLSYNPENLHTVKDRDGQLQGTLKKTDLISFLKTIRTRNEQFAKKRLGTKTLKETRKLIKPIKYYAIGEYGHDTYRPHYHALIFNLQPELSNVREKNNPLTEIWGKGFVHPGHGNGVEAGIAYCTKYMIKMDTQQYGPKQEQPFAIMSKKLGYNYIEKHKKWHVDNVAFYVIKQIKGNAVKLALADYYKEKIFTPVQREVQKSKEEKLRWKREDEQRAKLQKQGMNRESIEKYLVQLTMQKYNKIQKKALKNAKL